MSNTTMTDVADKVATSAIKNTDKAVDAIGSLVNQLVPLIKSGAIQTSAYAMDLVHRIAMYLVYKTIIDIVLMIICAFVCVIVIKKSINYARNNGGIDEHPWLMLLVFFAFGISMCLFRMFSALTYLVQLLTIPEAPVLEFVQQYIRGL